MTTLSNEEFIKGVFGAQADKALIAGFPGDPYDPNASKARWAVKQYAKGGYALVANEDWNGYYCVSTMRLDKDGRARRRTDLAEALHTLVMDDVGDPSVESVKVPARELVAQLEAKAGKRVPPSFAIETSPGNMQWGWLFTKPFEGNALCILVEHYWDLFARSLTADGKNPGSGDLTRLVRTPNNSNAKSKYMVGGKPFKCRTQKWEPDLRYDPKQFAVDVLGIPEADYDAAAAGEYVVGAKGKSGVLADYDDLSEDASGWGQALQKHGLVHGSHKSGAWDITCPYVETHTNKVDTGCAYLGEGRFKCFHGHCEERAAEEYLERLKEQYPGIEEDAAEAKQEMAKQQFDEVDANALANEEGFTREEMYAAIGLGPKDDPKTIQARYVWITPLDGFFDTVLRQMINKGAINTAYVQHRTRLAKDLAGWTGGKGSGPIPSPADSLRCGPGAREADTIEYAPGMPAYYEDVVRSTPGNPFYVANTWGAPDLGAGRNAIRNRSITPARKQRVLDLFAQLVEQLTGEKGDKPGGMDWRMYNWLALMVAAPERKPGWQWLITTKPGMGKDTLGHILGRLVGEDNWQAVGQDDVTSGYSAWAAKKYIIVNELSPATSGRKMSISVFDNLKTYLTAPPYKVVINPKYGKQYEAHNLGGFMFFSNHAFPMVIDRGERRLCYIDRLDYDNQISQQDWVNLHTQVKDNPVGLEIIGQWLRVRWENMTQAAKDELFGQAPDTLAKQQLHTAGLGKFDELILEWIEEDKEDGAPLWTLKQLRDRLDRAVKNDSTLRSMTVGQLGLKIREHGGWKPYMWKDKEGRVPGLHGGSRNRDVVWAMYEVPGKLEKTGEYTADQLRDMILDQNKARGGNVTTIGGKAMQDAEGVLSDVFAVEKDKGDGGQ